MIADRNILFFKWLFAENRRFPLRDQVSLKDPVSRRKRYGFSISCSMRRSAPKRVILRNLVR